MAAVGPAPTESLSPRRRMMVLAAMTGSLAMILLDVTAVGIALPTISMELGGSGDTAWVVNAYCLALASLVAIGGKLGDQLGKVSTFVGGVVIFATGSALCGLSSSIGMLVAMRVLQGLGAALMQPASAAMVVSSFPEGRRGAAMGVYVGVSMLFMAAGPVLGGALTSALSWHWVFWINLPIAAAMLLLIALARPASPKSAERGTDWCGALLFVPGMVSVIYGLQGATAVGWANLRCWGSIAIGVVLVLAFVRRQLNHPSPLLRLRLLAQRPILSDALLIGFTQFAIVGSGVFTPVLLQRTMGFSPLRAGVATLPLFLPLVFIPRLGGRLYDRGGIAAPAKLGTLLLTGAFVLLFLGAWWSSYPLLAMGMALLGAGTGLVTGPANTDALSRVDQADRGQVSGLTQTFRQFGAALGVATVTAAVHLKATVFGPDVRADGTQIAQAIAVGYAVTAVAACSTAILARFLLRDARRISA